MTLLTTRRALIGVLVVSTSVLALYNILLSKNMIHSDLHVHDQMVRAVDGRLVARSQFDFHHIVEQWIQPASQSNRSTRRKERLIEDGRVIREAIEYGEGENEDNSFVDKFSQNKIDNHLKWLSNISSRHKLGNEDLAKQSNSEKEKPQWDNVVRPSQGKPARDRNDSASSNLKSKSSNEVDHKSTDVQKEPKNTISSQKTNPELKKSYITSKNRTKVPVMHRPSPESREKAAADDRGLEDRNVVNSRVVKRQLPGSDSKAADDRGLEDRNVVNSRIVKRQFPGSDSSEKAAADDRGVEDRNVVNSHVAKRQLLGSDSREKAAADDRGLEDRNMVNSRVAKRQLPGSESRVKADVKGIDTKASSHNVHVVSVNSKGRSVKVVKREVYQPKAAESRAKHIPPLNMANYQGNSPKEKEAYDFISDPRYSHLPLSVRKKLAALRKERTQRLEFIKMIRQRCEGRKYCLQRVKSSERYLHDDCFYQAIKTEKDGIKVNPCQCNMLHSSKSYVNFNATCPRVALVSLPGSGNTWVRGLLEQATGYCTGSMWCDPVLRAKQFCAEGIRTDTLAIKNHDPTIRWIGRRLNSSAGHTDLNKPTFGSAIFVHRDPYEATIAEWNRALGFMVHNATKHNQTVAGIGRYDINATYEQHTVVFGKKAFGTSHTHTHTHTRHM